MATDKTGTGWQGLLLQDPRITTVWEAQSSYSQADPQPGAVEAQSADTKLALRPSGTMPADTELRIQTREPGHPEPGGGGFVWREAADSDTEWRGRDVPSVITSFEALDWVDVATATTSTTDPHCVTLSDGTIVAAYQASTALNPKILRVRTRATGASWSGNIEVRTDLSSASNYLPGLCVLPNDDLLLAARYKDSAQAEDNIYVYRSTDKGATWTLATTGALRTAIDNSAGSSGFDLRRLRMAYLDGQVSLVVDAISNDAARTWRDTYIQYASDSLGGRFDLIETGAATHLFAFPSVLQNGTSFLIVYTGNTGANRRYLRILPDAFTPLSNVTDIVANPSDVVYGTFDGTSKYLTDGDGTAFLAPDGALYILTRFVSFGGNPMQFGEVLRSYDLGETWSSVGAQPFGGTQAGGIWYRLDPATVPGSSGTYPERFAATFSEGRVVVLCNHVASPGTEDSSMNVIYLGGPSQITMPGIRDAYNDTDRVGWDQTGLPWDLPGDTIWIGAGAPTTENLNNARLEISCAAGETRRYSMTPTATVDEGMIVRHAFQVYSGGDNTTDRINIQVRLDDGVDGYDIVLRAQVDGFRVYDLTAAANIGSEVSVSGPIEVIIALGKGKIATWYRVYNQNADREWFTGPAGTVGNSNGAGGNDLIRWGVVATGATTAGVYWFEWHANTNGDVGPGLHDGFTNPGGLFPAYYAGYNRRTWIDAGAFISATDGPAFTGDLYNYDTRYGYPIGSIFTAESPTPRVKWRSTDTSEQQIAFQLEPGVGLLDNSRPGNDVLGMTVLGANFRTGKVQGYLVGTGWVNLSTFDAASGLSWVSGRWARDGNTWFPAGAVLFGPYLHHGEFAGGYIDVGGTHWKRIRTNTSGIGAAGGTSSKKATIIVEDAIPADPTTGTFKIVPRNFTVLVNLLGVSYAGYRLVIDSQSNPDGYFEIGNIILGWVEPFGHPYSWGRAVEWEAGVNASRSGDNIYRSSFRSPTARVIELAWVEGVDTSQLWSDTASPDYIEASTTAGGPGVAIVAEAPHQLSGILTGLHASNAPKNPAVVYLPSVGTVTDAVEDTVLNRREQFVAAHLDPRIRMEVLQGEENSPVEGEVVRVAQVILREMV